MNPSSGQLTRKPAGDKLTFFRQSGWMVLATIAGGVFMSAVHVVVSKPMLESEYGVFCALLRVFLLMGFPAAGLQVVFAQQSAAASSALEERKLVQTVRSVLRATFLGWLGMAALVVFWHSQIIATLKIYNPIALWATLLLGLASLWAPILRGVLQGRQAFAGLGWVMILDGVGRFTAIVLIVHFGGQAAGAMTGAFVGQLVAFGVAAYLARHILSGPGMTFAWAPWLRKVVPLTLGVGAVLFLANADVVYVQAVFSKDEAPFYNPAAMIGLALVSFTTPLASVMFPKIVQSAARTEKSDALGQALAATALLGVAAAVACSLFPQLPLRIIYFRNPDYWKVAPLVPWFAWALLPLILANVLINNLLARERFRAVPWLALVALGYGLTLFALKDRIPLFSSHDVKNAPAFVQKLSSQADPVSSLVWNQFPPEQRSELTAPGANREQSRKTLVQELNRLVQGPSLYDRNRFERLPLSKEVQQLISKQPVGKELVRLNRLLLQEVFPANLPSSREKLFAGFKMVVGTLGVFSALLLAVALGCTFRQPSPARLTAK